MKGQVLVIDDNPLDIKIASHAIERIGYACHGFTEHLDALKWTESSTPQFIFLDLQMPTITGFEVIGILRGLQSLKSVPIFIISGKNNTDDVMRAIKLGATDYVVKPLDPLVIQEKVKKAEDQSKSDFFSLNLEKENVISAYISKPIEILSISEFGLTLRSGTEMKKGETIELTSVPTEIFGKNRLLLRCLSCDMHAEQNFYFLQMTYVGMHESQRQAIRKSCRQMWIQKKETL